MGSKILKRHGAIAFVDILGTKTKWREEVASDFLKKIELLYDELDEIYRGIRKIGDIEELEKFKFYEALEILEKKSKETTSKTLKVKKGKSPRSLSLFFKEYLQIEVSTFSDTLILALYSEIIDEEHRIDWLLLHLLAIILAQLLRSAFMREIYLRGSLSIGTFYILKKEPNKLMLIGPAVNEVAETYGSTNWIGISTAPSSSLTLEQDTNFLKWHDKLRISIGELCKRKNKIKRKLPAEHSALLDFLCVFVEYVDELKKIFIQYDIPTKNGNEKCGWAIAWPLLRDNAKEVELKLFDTLDFRKFQKNTIGYDVFLKFRNTQKFYNFCIKKGLNINLRTIIRKVKKVKPRSTGQSHNRVQTGTGRARRKIVQ